MCGPVMDRGICNGLWRRCCPTLPQVAAQQHGRCVPITPFSLVPHMKKSSIVAVVAMMLAGACQPDPYIDIDTVPHQGNASFDKFVSIGGSTVAGVMDGALHTAGQQHAFPAIMASRFALTKGGPFVQPDINADNGLSGIAPDGTLLGKYRLTVNSALGTPRPVPVTPGQPVGPYVGDRSLINNFGIPGLKAMEAVQPGFGEENPYFGRIAANPGSSVVRDAGNANGTYVLFWLGPDDVLGYAKSGATGIDGGTNPDDLTSVAAFRQHYAEAFGEVFKGQSLGVAATIPDIEDLPYFRSLPLDPVELTAQEAEALNQSFLFFNIAVLSWNTQVDLADSLNEQQKGELRRSFASFNAGKNFLLIEDRDLSDAFVFLPPTFDRYNLPKIRKIRGGEMVLLSLPQEGLANGLGTYEAVPAQHVLTAREILRIKNRTTAFNNIIRETAEATGFFVALADMFRFYKDLRIGIPGEVGGQAINAGILPPSGAFSSDGLNLNPRGAALLANEFIRVTNGFFLSNVPAADVNAFPPNETP